MLQPQYCHRGPSLSSPASWPPAVLLQACCWPSSGPSRTWCAAPSRCCTCAGCRTRRATSRPTQRWVEAVGAAPGGAGFLSPFMLIAAFSVANAPALAPTLGPSAAQAPTSCRLGRIVVLLGRNNKEVPVRMNVVPAQVAAGSGWCGSHGLVACLVPSSAAGRFCQEGLPFTVTDCFPPSP